MTKQKRITVALLLILSAALSAQSCLWKVQGDRAPIYLLGSVHMLRADNYPLKPAIRKAYEEADALAFEVNLDSTETMAVQQMIMLTAMAKEGRSLKDLLSKETYALARAKGGEMGLDIARFEDFKPWFFTVSLMALKIQQFGFQPQHGVDRHFFQKAKADGKPVKGLETIQYQISMFDSLSQSDSDEFVKQGLEEFDVIGQEMESLITSWESGDVKAMSELLLDSFKEYPDIYRALIVKRNNNWLPQVHQYLKEGTCALIVVGTGHLLGPDGLAERLKGMGYKVEQQ